MSHIPSNGAGSDVGFTDGALSERAGVHIDAVKAILEDLAEHGLIELWSEARDPATGALLARFPMGTVPDATMIRGENGTSVIRPNQFTTGYSKDVSTN